MAERCSIEQYAIALAQHFVNTYPLVRKSLARTETLQALQPRRLSHDGPAFHCRSARLRSTSSRSPGSAYTFRGRRTTTVSQGAGQPLVTPRRVLSNCCHRLCRGTSRGNSRQCECSLSLRPRACVIRPRARVELTLLRPPSILAGFAVTGTETRTVYVTYDKAGKLGVTAGECPSGQTAATKRLSHPCEACPFVSRALNLVLTQVNKAGHFAFGRWCRDQVGWHACLALRLSHGPFPLPQARNLRANQPTRSPPAASPVHQLLPLFFISFTQHSNSHPLPAFALPSSLTPFPSTHKHSSRPAPLATIVALPYNYPGLKDLSVLKTTQSGYEGFLRDQYTLLPEVRDRIMATTVTCTWKYTALPPCYDAAFAAAKSGLVDAFYGPAKGGIYSPSVQYTLYDMAKRLLDRVPQVRRHGLGLSA